MTDEKILCARYNVWCIGEPCKTRLYERCPYFDDLTGSAKAANIRMVQERQGIYL